MPPQLNIKKQLAESGEGIYINRWWTGLMTNRSPLFVPVSALGLQIIARHDALSDGENIELSPRMSLVRRPGLPRYCSAALGAEKPLAFFSFKNVSGTINVMVDTTLKVSSFTTSAITALYTKGTTVQTSFAKVGDVLYMCDGTNLKKWDGTTLAAWGIAAPAVAAALSFGAGSLSPTRGFKYVYVYKNSGFGHISTSAPFSASTGALTTQNITVQVTYSTDTQVDKIDIYRTKDGGSVYYFLAEIANNSAGGTANYTDSTADSALNTNLIAPINHLNDPPPSGASLAIAHVGYMFVAVRNKLYVGAGPAATNGVPEECFPPANVWPFPGNITALASTTNGLCVWTADDMFVLFGQDILSFFPKKTMPNFGVYNQNCVAQDGDLLFVLTSKNQLFTISDSLNEIGFNVRDQLAPFPFASRVIILRGGGRSDPALGPYLALHRSGTDEGLFVSDGAGAIYRYSVTQQMWCPVALITGGVGAIASCEVATADYRLMAGRASNAGYLLARDIDGSSYFDDTSATPYTGYVTVGAIMLAPPGSTATIKNILLETLPRGTYPTVAVRPNEIDGTFTTLPNPVPDPPMLLASSTIWMKRHYLKAAATPVPEQMRFLYIQISLIAENEANEINGLALGA